MNQQEAERIAEELLAPISFPDCRDCNGAGQFYNPYRGMVACRTCESKAPKERSRRIVAALLSTATAEYARGVEDAARIADDAREDEEYGHAAFRCVQIAQNIRALLDHPQVERSAWLPIESAPVSQRILAVVDGAVRIVLYGKTSHVPMYGFCLADQGVEDFDLCEPTCWMPLPVAPPSTVEDEQRG